MNDDALKKTVAELLKDDRGEAALPYQQVKHKLLTLAEAIRASIEPREDAVEVRLEAGHRVNLGQQFSFVVYVPLAKLRDVLFRAYVPVDGFPVTLDLFDDQHPHCDDLDALEKAILGFLAHPDVKLRLLEVRDLAA
jgi:hypothetical protein